MTMGTGLIYSLINVTSCRDATCSSSNAWIMVLLKLIFFLVHSFLHYRIGDDLWYSCCGFSERLGYSLLRMLTKMIEVAKLSHTVQSSYKPTLRLIVGVLTSTIKHSVFLVMVGLIVEIVFILRDSFLLFSD